MAQPKNAQRRPRLAGFNPTSGAGLDYKALDSPSQAHELSASYAVNGAGSCLAFHAASALPAAATRDAIQAAISEARQADARAPILRGLGKFPARASL
jgi:AhpD family alkylhydroperoxidase